jgi:hypothetical protein
MKSQSKYFVSIFLVLILLTGWVTPASAALDIISVTPDLVFNDEATTITVTGSGFVAGAVVSLENYGDLSTSVDSDTQLKAVVRPGVPASTYTVVVTNPNADESAFRCDSCLTVADPSPIPFDRPQIVISSYRANDFAQWDEKFKIKIRFENKGTSDAFNAQAVFSSADVVPTDTGGVLALDPILADGNVDDVEQTFFVPNSVYGKTIVVIDVALTYYDEAGTAYSDKFTLNVATDGGASGNTDYYATATPTGVNSAQLVITSYASTVDPLQPGEHFQLGVTVQNMGNASAKHVTMIVGGGSSGSSDGTPQPDGVSGGGGEFTNFAPVGSSNIQSLGDIPAGGALQVLQNLVVNVSTNPGAYPMKMTFSYINGEGEVVNDDQVITLLVYSLPILDVSFYAPTEPFFVDQPGALPLQIVNLGKRSTVLGNVRIKTKTGMLEPPSSLVGSLDPGGYFTFDATLTPYEAGPLELEITVEYTDDFNQPRTITRALSVTVEEAFIEATPDPTLEGVKGVENSIASNESFLHKAWRFALGLFGLDSAPPVEEIPSGGPALQEMPIPLPAGGGGKG